MFSDIVGWTEKAAELGDRRWHQLLEGHHTRLRAQLQRFRGRELDTAADGFVATFDGRLAPCGAYRRSQTHSYHSVSR